MTDWIGVKERYPDPLPNCRYPKKYLVYGPIDYGLAQYDKELEYLWKLYEFTHWAELPEPPEDI